MQHPPIEPRRLLLGSLPILALVAACAAVQERRSVSVAPPLNDVEGSAFETALRVELPALEPVEEDGLHNLYRLSEQIVSGGEPHDESSFRRLQQMGIRTILSVDGKAPDAELAERYGMSYVHVPIQYRGLRDDELLAIAKTFRERPGPFYVHCFHGKHRGPAAAEIGRLVVDGISREQALAEMRQWCGTAESYEGLYAAIATGAIPDAEETRAFDFDFPSAHAFQGLRQAMIGVSRVDENLLYLSRNGWRAGAEHPDANAPNEAAKLAEGLRQCAALEDVALRPDDFRRWMDEAVVSSRELHETLQALERMEGRAEDADAAYARVKASCKACHAVYRNE